MCSFTFFGSKSTISRFGVRFRDGQYSLVSFLFAVLTHGAPVRYGVGATATHSVLTLAKNQFHLPKIIANCLRASSDGVMWTGVGCTELTVL